MKLQTARLLNVTKQDFVAMNKKSKALYIKKKHHDDTLQWVVGLAHRFRFKVSTKTVWSSVTLIIM